MIHSVTVVGAGLMGASVGLAARRHDIDVVLVDVDPEQARRAADLGAGQAGGTPDDATVLARGPSDVVVLATPPRALAPALRFAQQNRLGRTFTDVGSVKVEPRRAAAALGCDLTSYVGGHPMAGRERTGPGAARADLFVGRPWILTPGEAGAEHVDRVRSLAVACGAVPVLLDEQVHDEAVALVSHVPQVVSSLLAARLRDAPADAVGLAGQGLRDLTRIAGSDAALWTAILAANAGPVHDVLCALREDLDRVIAALSALAASAAGEAGPARDLPTGPAAARDVLTGLLRAGAAGRARMPGKHGTAPTAYVTVPVVVPDRPGELARLFADSGASGVNVEDVTIEHSPGQPVGLVELAVHPEVADQLAGALRRRGWTVHR